MLLRSNEIINEKNGNDNNNNRCILYIFIIFGIKYFGVYYLFI